MNLEQASRRRFLQLTGLATGGLLVGAYLPGCSKSAAPHSPLPASISPNAFIQITASRHIFFYLPRDEMGQGVYHGLTTVLAEELDALPEQIDIRFAGVHKAYKNPELGFQGTGGSTSMKSSFQPLREAAAQARQWLLQAAARQLDAPIGELSTSAAHIHWRQQRYHYGDFAELAVTLAPPKTFQLKKAAQFQLIGRDRPRLDGLAKATGTAIFALDIDLPNLHRAAVVRCPVAGGRVKSFNRTHLLALPGVIAAVDIGNGVGIVAAHYWQARQAGEQAQIDWDMPALSGHSSDTLLQRFQQALEHEPGSSAQQSGDADAAFAQSPLQLEADYWAPYLAHATMEPMNCTVQLDNGYCDVWVGTQAPELTRAAAALFAEIDEDKVRLHPCFMGGGFGRRIGTDYIREAISIAKACQLPIQLVWSREDDMRHDFYRPAAMARFSAGLDAHGQLISWRVKRVGPNIMPHIIDQAADFMLPHFLPSGLSDWISKRGYGLFTHWLDDPQSTEGLSEDYDCANKSVTHVTLDPGLPVGFWRSVGHSFSGFFKESFIDELAHASGQDPLAFRLRHCRDNPRLARAIEAVATLSGWQQPLPDNRFRGIAAHSSFDSVVAQVAEVSINQTQISVHRVFCVIDCGLVVNPDIVKAQMEGGIIFGISAALLGKITLKDGAVEQSNFHDYPVLRMVESPQIEVAIIDSEAAPTGVGEPGVPPIAAAIANAVFAASGQRLRSLPLTLAG